MDEIHPPEIPDAPFITRWQFFFLVALLIIGMAGTGWILIEQNSAQLSAEDATCARAVASDYEEARDNILLAIGGQGDFRTSTAALTKLYFPNGVDNAKISRAERTQMVCG